MPKSDVVLRMWAGVAADPVLASIPMFIFKGTVPPGVTMSDVFRAMYPFVALQVVGLILCIWFPGISLWLPRLAGFLE